MVSHKSVTSKASRNLRDDIKPAVPKKKANDLLSEITVDLKPADVQSDSSVDEEDEWTAI
jgi:hypothetical protein